MSECGGGGGIQGIFRCEDHAPVEFKQPVVFLRASNFVSQVKGRAEAEGFREKGAEIHVRSEQVDSNR